jgi:hypothetical protein
LDLSQEAQYPLVAVFLSLPDLHDRPKVVQCQPEPLLCRGTVGLTRIPCVQ